MSPEEKRMLDQSNESERAFTDLFRQLEARGFSNPRIVRGMSDALIKEVEKVFGDDMNAFDAFLCALADHYDNLPKRSG